MPGLDTLLAVHLHEDVVMPFAMGTVARGGMWSMGDITSIANCYATARLDVAALCALCSLVVRVLT